MKIKNHLFVFIALTQVSPNLLLEMGHAQTNVKPVVISSAATDKSRFIWTIDRLFSKFDSSKSGFIDRKIANQIVRNGQFGKDSVPFYMGVARFQKVDINKDQRISKAEFIEFGTRSYDFATKYGAYPLDFTNTDVLLRYKSYLR